MARIKLTKPWACNRVEWPQYREFYVAKCHSIRLRVSWSYSRKLWIAMVAAGEINRRYGFCSTSVRQAKREAERVALEMLEEIARTVGPWLAQFGMEVDDGE